MEDRGYLVAHPTLIDPKGHAPAEQQHITHKVKGQKRPAHHLVNTFLQALHQFVFFVFFNSQFFLPSLCTLTSGAAGGQRHPQPPQLRQEEPVQQLQRSHRAALLQVQYQHHGESEWQEPIGWAAPVSYNNGITLPPSGEQRRCLTSCRNVFFFFSYNF